MRRAERAFTLLEALAAVAILGVLYTMLIGVAMQGLRAEGTSKRRLEASLIADRELAELELQLDVGVVPPIGEEEVEAGDFRVRVAVRPFDLLLPELATPSGQPSPLLADLTSDRSSPLRVIEVRVAWLEADVEYEIVRSTFGFDANALDPSLLPELQSPPGSNAAEPA